VTGLQEPCARTGEQQRRRAAAARPLTVRRYRVTFAASALERHGAPRVRRRPILYEMDGGDGWQDDDEELDVPRRLREELRREMCGDKEPSELLSLAIYEAVEEDWSANSEDVFDMYLRLARDADTRPPWEDVMEASAA